jgi:hypothetical protein
LSRPASTPIYDLRFEDRISGADAREGYVNLMRWRLERVLGYRWTHPLELKDTRGLPLYHMIFATDNEAGTQIMEHLYSAAAAAIPEMRTEAADRTVGQPTLDLGLARILEPATGTSRRGSRRA